jgi:hypothetical protein
MEVQLLAEFRISVEELTPVIAAYLSTYLKAPIDPDTLGFPSWESDDDGELISITAQAQIFPNDNGVPVEQLLLNAKSDRTLENQNEPM